MERMLVFEDVSELVNASLYNFYDQWKFFEWYAVNGYDNREVFWNCSMVTNFALKLYFLKLLSMVAKSEGAAMSLSR